ncbi:hypothetical protein GCM10023091_20930 [Ravibacter arvi]|uniref:DUF4292 domain-containing protein n=1 Tax=Ravibacter arvi TaxID=2051041 RepID=A0ABP8LWZ0_9BACT
MTKQLIVYALLIAALLTGCKRRQPQKLPSLTTPEDTFTRVDSLPDSLWDQTPFGHLTTRSKIWITSQRQNIDNAGVSFRVKKDSAIWLSASVLGLEVLRGIISVEGVRIIDRVNKIYLDANYATLAGKLGFPLDYPLLQSFFLGEIPRYPSQKFSVREQPGKVFVRQDDGFLAVYNVIEQAIGKTRSMEAIDLKTNNRAIANFDDFLTVDARSIPYKVTLNLSVKPHTRSESAQQIAIRLQHTSVSITDSALVFPFQVPINYKKAF